MTASQRHAVARYLVAHPDEIARALMERRWEELEAVAELIDQDAPKALIHTDPALYRSFRNQITEACISGWNFNRRKLQALAGKHRDFQPNK